MQRAESAAQGRVGQLLMPELADREKKYLVVLRLALYILALVLVLDWKSWGMTVALIALSAVATVLAVAYVKSFNGVSLADFKTPAGIASPTSYAVAHYGSALFLLVPVVHLVFKPGTIARIAIALLLLAYVVALLRFARAAGERSSPVAASSFAPPALGAPTSAELPSYRPYTSSLAAPPPATAPLRM